MVAKERESKKKIRNDVRIARLTDRTKVLGSLVRDDTIKGDYKCCYTSCTRC